MSYYEFGPNDLFYNRIKTHPKSQFFVYAGQVYYNSIVHEAGQFNTNARCIPSGHVSLYEVNVDREAYNIDGGNAFEGDGTTKTNSKVHTADSGPEFIYPWITKSSAKVVFKTVSTSSWNEADWGDKLVGKFQYPLSSSITREYFEKDETTTGNRFTTENKEAHEFKSQLTTIDGNLWPILEADAAYNETNSLITVKKSHIDSLKATLDHYTYLSPHYAYSSSVGHIVPGCHKDTQELGAIYIPSIFYGSSIKKGTVDLNFYVSGALLARCQDIKQNGELIQTTPKDTHGTGSVAGVVLYNEGVIILTGSWDLSANPDTVGSFNSPIYPANGTDGANHTEKYRVGESAQAPKWTFFGVGSNDTSGSFHRTGGTPAPSSSFSIDFEGTQYVSVMTMMAHAPKGLLNHSNNPTFLDSNGKETNMTPTVVSGIQYGYNVPVITSSITYSQDKEMRIKNTVSSSFGSGNNFTGSFKKQTYISKIGIYDENRRLVGVASVANPVKKTEDREFTFKLKYDI